MKMNPVQFNINNKFRPSFKKNDGRNSYLDAEGAVNTQNYVKPLPPQGHLIHDNFNNSIKYFFKDIQYDLKSIKNGINGTANDHQLGRLNDIGITTAGILIATYLASKTSNPRTRLMEYIGLGAFLTAMSIYPKLAINTPAKMVHGFDIDKEYIDDQGRKKSVMQDANYVPYDMYLGEIPEEDISVIGDKMDIPKDIKNRNDVIKEQMRKISTQNNTLWMLTAGVTPALAGLLCCGLEKFVVAPAVENTRILQNKKAVEEMLQKTSNMSSDLESIQHNPLSKKVEKLLTGYKSRELPKEEFDNLIKILSEDLYENTAEGLRTDLSEIIRGSVANETEAYIINNNTIENTLDNARNCISKRNKNSIERILVPTKEEFENIIQNSLSKEASQSKEGILKAESLTKLRKELSALIDTKISQTTGIPKSFLDSQKNKVLDNMLSSLKTQKSLMITEDKLKQIVDFAKILGEFKENQKVLSKCKEFNFEFASDTVIARSYEKFEKTLLDVLDIKFADLKKMRESEVFTKNLLDKKLIELSADDVKFEKAMKKLGDVISEMEVKLNGGVEGKSTLLDLINAIENNYNQTAIRLNKLGAFDKTIDKMIKQDPNTLKNTIGSRTELFDMLDGTRENVSKAIFNGRDWYSLKPEERLEYVLANSKGAGSSKNLEISRMVERYQGAKNSFNRILHTFDVYKRATKPETFAANLIGKDAKYIDKIISMGKETLLNASTSEHNMKLNTVNNPEFYKDLMNATWAEEIGSALGVKQKGQVTQATKKALEEANSLAKGNVLDRFQRYIMRFRNIVGNSTIDFTKPGHILNPDARNYYSMADKTRMAMFNLVGQSPVDMAKGAAGRRFATQKWARIIGAITGSVFGIAILAQFGFGKLNNPQNLQKQVNNDKN